MVFMTKKKILTVILLVVVIAAVIIGLIFELDYFDVIDLDYKPKYPGVAYEDLGSAKKLEGKTALVTVFASDGYDKWDFTQPEDKKKREELLRYLSVGTDWLIEQGKKYRVELEFVQPFDENDNVLYYEHDFGDIIVNDDYMSRFMNKEAGYEWDFIDSCVNNDAIYNELGCQNVVYYFFYDGGTSPNTFIYELNVYNKPFERPYELVVSPYWYIRKNQPISPDMLIHELLHDFGAPDLYAPDNHDVLYHTTSDFVDFCSVFHTTDIMYTTGGNINRQFYWDRVDAEITDITAYYLGWINDPPLEVDFFRLVRSQHEQH